MALLTEWTAPTEITLGDGMTATLFNEKLMQNMLYLITPNEDQYLSDGDADWTTTSAVPVAIDSSVMRVEVEIVSGAIEIWGNLQFAHDNDTQYYYVGVQIDDDYLLGDVPAGVKTLYLKSHRVQANNELSSVNFKTQLFGLTAGTHSANPFVWTNGGTLTWDGDILNDFGIREIK